MVADFSSCNNSDGVFNEQSSQSALIVPDIRLILLDHVTFLHQPFPASVMSASDLIWIKSDILVNSGQICMYTDTILPPHK